MILIIYIIGCIIALMVSTYFCIYKQYQKGEDITLGNIIIAFILAIASWVLCATYLIAYLIDKSDKVIIKKPKNK